MRSCRHIANRLFSHGYIKFFESGVLFQVSSTFSNTMRSPTRQSQYPRNARLTRLFAQEISVEQAMPASSGVFIRCMFGCCLSIIIPATCDSGSYGFQCSQSLAQLPFNHRSGQAFCQQKSLVVGWFFAKLMGGATAREAQGLALSFKDPHPEDQFRGVGLCSLFFGAARRDQFRRYGCVLLLDALLFLFFLIFGAFISHSILHFLFGKIPVRIHPPFT